jgi:N-acetyldiaminopimelate deacetylase
MPDLNRIRQDLHRIPEPGFDEWKTNAYLTDCLRGYRKLKLHTFDFPGILVEYTAGTGPYRLFRADMDALPIPEETGCDFPSIHPGWSHACGHDVHMTVLLGLIDAIMTDAPATNLLFLFQPAEEGLGGAKRILDTGILDRFPIEAAYALHVNGRIPTGTVSTRPGRFFCIPQEFDVVFTGRSAHVAFPQHGADALAAASAFLETISRLLKLRFPATEPVVCHIGRMEAGNVRNAIADRALLQGTTRSFTRETWLALNRMLEEASAQAAAIYGVTSAVKFLSWFDPVVNDETLYRRFRELLPQDIGYIEAEPVMTGEDFGFITSRYPGLLFWLGAGEDGDLHSGKFLPDSACIPVGVEILRRLALDPHPTR